MVKKQISHCVSMQFFIITGMYLYVATNKYHTFATTISIVSRKSVTYKSLNFSGPYYRESTKLNAFHLGWQGTLNTPLDKNHDIYNTLTDDTVLYKVQAAYCSGSTYTFSCDKPDHVMWVGQGLIWGSKHNSAPNNETCMPREGDCQYAELDNEFLDVSISLRYTASKKIYFFMFWSTLHHIW